MRKKKDDRRRRRDRRSRIEEEKKDESEQSSVIETFKISQCSAFGIFARSTSSLHTFFFIFLSFFTCPLHTGFPHFSFQRHRRESSLRVLVRSRRPAGFPRFYDSVAVMSSLFLFLLETVPVNSRELLESSNSPQKSDTAVKVTERLF